MATLLACPFCGNVPDIEDADCIYPVDRERTVWNLVCFAAGGGCDASILADSYDACITLWNTRYAKSDTQC